MSTDQTSRRLTAAALACAALLALLGGAAAPARAHTSRLAQASPGETLAEALRSSPVYVDASLEAALPAADQRQLEAEIAATGVPLYVLMVPLIAGDPWGGDPEQLATVVHDHLGGDGVFITLARSSGDGRLDAYEWPARQHQAKSAANAVTHEEELRDASLHARLSRAIELIASGEGDAAYEAATEDLRSDPPGGASGDTGEAEDAGGSPAPLAIAAGVLLAVAIPALALTLRARRRRLPEDLMLPRTVFPAAQAATADELRQHASRELVAFGQLVKANPDLQASHPDGAADDLQVALDAYDAAAKVLDDARGIPDIAGVLVLLDVGRDHLARASARAEGRQAPAPTPLCFFNPLHGSSATTVSWRPLGTRDQLRAAACSACAERVRTRRAPEVLTDRLDGREVPYFEVPPDRSVWSATGYGVLRGDLVQRVLRGDHTRARS